MDKKDVLDDRNQDLFDRIIATGLEPKYIPSGDDCWGAHIEDDKYFVIEYAPTKWKHASFTHELLHIYTQKINGYKRVLNGQGGNFHPSFFAMFCTDLDNQFQHIKFYDDFIKRKFKPHEFYCESDLTGTTKLKNILSTTNLDIYNIALNFCNFVSPGGIISDEEKLEIKELFYNYDNKKYKKELSEIERVYADWKADTSYNSEPYFNRLFKIFKNGQVWLSYTRKAIINDTTTGFIAG